MKTVTKYGFLYFLGGLALLFILAPLLNMFFSTGLDELFAATRDREAGASMWLTLWVSCAATLVFAVVSVPLAYLIAHSPPRVKSFLIAVVSIPIVIPHSAAGIAILGLVSRETAVGSLAEKIGLSFIDNPMGIALAMAYVSVPFLILSAVNGFSEVPSRYGQAARSMGATKSRVFFTIDLPLARRSVFSGMVMMFSRGISEFGAVVMVAYFPMITPVLIYDRFTSFGLTHARPIAVVFVAICLIIFFAFHYFTHRRKKNAC